MINQKAMFGFGPGELCVMEKPKIKEIPEGVEVTYSFSILPINIKNHVDTGDDDYAIAERRN